MPVLRGIGGNLTCPLGVATVSVEVQGLKKTIEIYVVEDYVLSYSALLGHSFTEKPDIIMTKTPTKIVFERLACTKIRLIVEDDTEIDGNVVRPIIVNADGQGNGSIYVHGSLRGAEGKEYYLFPGTYEIKDSRTALLIYNASSNKVCIKKDTLLTRALRNTHPTPFFQSCSVLTDRGLDEEISCNPELTKQQPEELQKLLFQHSDCFSSGLKDLGFTNITEMVIDLNDTEPVVYRPCRMSHTERQLVRDMVKEMVDNGRARESSSSYASPIVLVQKKE
ncbi:uncharacterized protein LOC134199843 [Bombyx mori]|uniref:uncharacterized protein LOC134199843 n=1 Tax=Bombyx mori TaxID=7091 RepID=UPI002ED42936